jgi:hypothetical protein
MTPDNFSTTAVVDNQTTPSFAVLGEYDHGFLGLVWNVWQPSSQAPFRHLYFSKSIDEGKNWEPGKQILGSTSRIDFTPGNLAVGEGKSGDRLRIS